ncbi:MAG: helix-turn-helix transcriptional regulator [Thiotrichaceae bacterium]|jgi:transcriptional regulator with XRE-family HTH domain|nr:helix-turn-helix transcriptional regulator [Thiotrichaceae bacterium]
MLSHAELKAKMLENPEVKAEYDRLAPEMELLDELLRARMAAGLTQAQVAERMNTQAPVISRLESTLMSGKHSPSVATLRKYAEAVGCKLEIHLVVPKP